MSKSRLPDQGLPGWTFYIEEVSYGCYQADARHDDGRTVSRQGTDYERLVAQCVDDARTLPERRQASAEGTARPSDVEIARMTPDELYARFGTRYRSGST